MRRFWRRLFAHPGTLTRALSSCQRVIFKRRAASAKRIGHAHRRLRKPKPLQDPKAADKKTDPAKAGVCQKPRPMWFWQPLFGQLDQCRALKNKNHQTAVKERNPRDEFVKGICQSMRRHKLLSVSLQCLCMRQKSRFSPRKSSFLLYRALELW